ncbi:MAG: hypothetical protein AUH14_05070 [Candidatus Rokubacteria bacterium 13_2_20CM_69_15_1]|nr:MAG: hypothetical protein AUH14_05070 [Candidatus Rokubacteria bacterium 13_2_20CM_69_15_1]
MPLVEPGDRAPIGLRVKGRYRIVRELGAGAFGNVCLAEDETTGHRVAIRLLPRGLAATPHAAEAVQRRGRSVVAASTGHPGLVRVLEFGEAENGRAFVAMELVEGRRLSETLSGCNTLDVDAALRLVLDLGAAVETLHNMGAVHGALRPRNVMVLEDGRVKLMDVELAGLRDAPAMESILAAESPAEYLSPEQIRRAPVTEKTDIYAFGVVLYEMLCGVPPFQAPTREVILAKHLTETPVPIRRRRHGVSASVERLVAQALDKKPEARPLMQDVLNGLWADANGPATRWKRTAAIAGVGALAASLAAIVVWGLFEPRPSTPRQLAQPSPPPAVKAIPLAAPPRAAAPAPPAVALPPAVKATPPPVPPVVAAPAPPAVTPSPAVKATPPPAPPRAVAPAPAAVAPPPAVKATPPPAPPRVAAPAPPAVAPPPAAKAAPAPAPPPPSAATVTSGGVPSVAALAADAQPRRKTYRVGWLDSGRVSAPYQDVVRQALVGYPQDIAFEYRSADGRADRLQELAAELVRLKVDIMFAVGNQAIQTAKQATRTIPIVMIGSDAVAPGTAVRLDEPSGNVTGVTYSSAELARSWVKLLKELRPTLSRVAVLYNADPTSQVELTSLQRAAAAAGMKIQAYAIQEGEAIGNAFAGPPAERAEAVIVPGGPLALIHLRRIVDRANRAGVPTIYGHSEFVDAGGLMAYGPSLPATYRRAGAYIGKILSPTDPRDLPVEQPSRFELVINLKTAKALGLTLPESLVLRADRVLR